MTQGKKLINLKAKDTIESLERIAKIEDAEEAGKAAASPQTKES